MTKVSISMSVSKIGILIVTGVVFYLISNPYPVCWEAENVPKNFPQNSTDESIYNYDDGKKCVKTTLFENFMCAKDPWKDAWWSVTVTNPTKFCIARTSTYMAMLLQLGLICTVQLVHMFSLIKRSFTNYDPLDMVPAFFTICALSSVLIIQIMLSSNWSDLWEHNAIQVPSSPMPHTALTCIISVGMVLSAFDWILYHVIYNAEQDQIEENALMTNGNGSDKEHED